MRIAILPESRTPLISSSLLAVPPLDSASKFDRAHALLLLASGSPHTVSPR